MTQQRIRKTYRYKFHPTEVIEGYRYEWDGGESTVLDRHPYYPPKKRDGDDGEQDALLSIVEERL